MERLLVWLSTATKSVEIVKAEVASLAVRRNVLTVMGEE
jgi:hypothetical protein